MRLLSGPNTTSAKLRLLPPTVTQKSCHSHLLHLTLKKTTMLALLCPQSAHKLAKHTLPHGYRKNVELDLVSAANWLLSLKTQ
jgi:hypothetical protein